MRQAADLALFEMASLGSASYYRRVTVPKHNTGMAAFHVLRIQSISTEL